MATRREWLRVGGLGAFGLGLARLLQPVAWTGAGARVAAEGLPAPGTGFGRAKSCILLFLAGGPPQHETFDPKPDAPSEIRDVFRSIRTSVPGSQGYEPQTKAENVPPGPQDWPSLASVVASLKPSTRSPMSSVVLPEPLATTATSCGPGRMAGSWGQPGIPC
jgi:hypothetical protein